MLKEKKFNLKDKIIGIGVIILYLVMSSIPFQFLALLGINYLKLNLIARVIYLLFYEALLAVIIIYIYRKDFIPDFKDFKKNWLNYLDKYLKYWLLILVLMVISNLIVSNFTTTTISQNQSAILTLIKKVPIYTFISTAIIAPITEELVFRLSIRKIIPKLNILFILVSGLVFGSLHVIGAYNNPIDLLFIIPYTIPGCIFAYLYVKSNNICVPISIHLIHNLVLVTIQMFLLV